MTDLDRTELKSLYEGEFTSYREEDWAREWRRKYSEQVRRVQDADWEEWRTPAFQEMIWDSPAVASIGPGQSVTVRGAYEDEGLARLLFDARGSLTDLALEQRGGRLQKLYDEVMTRVFPTHSKRRPRARLTRLLAAMFPEDMTSIADANRIWRVQRRLSAPRVSGDFIAQHPTVRSALQDAVGKAETLEQKVDQAIFAWFLWQKYFGKPDEGAVVTQAAQREASAVPPFSILPANAQRRSLTCVKGNIELLMAMVREAEHGISRQDLVTVILTEATQLNAASAGNILSQAMGGLGLLRVDGSDIYRPTDRGLELLTVDDPSAVLRGPLIGRVFGMGHLLLMVRREPGVLKPTDAAKRLQSHVPTWKSTQPGSHICTWARLVGLIDVQNPGGVLVLTDDGEDYAAALPEDFEAQWSFHSGDEALSGAMEFAEDRPTVSSVAIRRYDIDTIVEEGCFLPPDEIRAALELLRRKKNIILQGPPGTGKTWLAKRLGYSLIGARDHQRLTAVQFQPTLSYEDFVRGWRPDGTKGLQLVDGVFLDAVAAATQEPQTPYVLVIEEINRGNPAQIFGEMLTLIEDSKRNEDEALRLAYPRTIEERRYVPDNLYIIGTMNVADRSLALVDLALRRRFSFVSLAPQFNDAWSKWLLDRGAPARLVSLIGERMRSLNAAIEGDRALGRQFRVGHSFMTPHAAPADEESWRSWYLDTVRAELAPLLEEYWFDNDEAARTQISQLLAI
ncbi:McrB family protein [Rhizobium sp. Nf11,1]|uniref:McrB family protein n=1 Tax=Rhizobium sp. Nf11,1 TaxID=3404923 RepID=UPI003D34724A